MTGTFLQPGKKINEIVTNDQDEKNEKKTRCSSSQPNIFEKFRSDIFSRTKKN